MTIVNVPTATDPKNTSYNELMHLETTFYTNTQELHTNKILPASWFLIGQRLFAKARQFYSVHSLAGQMAVIIAGRE